MAQDKDDGQKAVSDLKRAELLARLYHGRGATIVALSNMSEGAERPNAITAAALHLDELQESLKPKDAIEEILIQELALTHARVVKLSAQSVIQQNERWHRALSEASDRATNTVRRLALTFKQYRENRQSTVTAVQNNFANQQIVQQQVLPDAASGSASPVKELPPPRQELTESTAESEIGSATRQRAPRRRREGGDVVPLRRRSPKK